MFRTYGEFIIPERGLSLDGLKRTYDDGAGDVDRDFEALNLQMGSIVGGFDTKKKAPQSMMTDFKVSGATYCVSSWNHLIPIYRRAF